MTFGSVIAMILAINLLVCQGFHLKITDVVKKPGDASGSRTDTYKINTTPASVCQLTVGSMGAHSTVVRIAVSMNLQKFS